MKRRVICLVLVCLFTLSNTAFATTWGYVGKGRAFSYNIIEYVDKDTVVKNGNKVIYWVLQIFEKPDVIGTKKEIWKCEVITSDPRHIRTLENYCYDANGHEIYHDITMGAFNPVDDNELLNRELAFALKYAREGKDDGQKPTLP